MQSDPDQRSSQPDQREGEPSEPVGDGAGLPPPGSGHPAQDGPPQSGPPTSESEATGPPPPMMPRPPQMPRATPGPASGSSAWIPPPPPPPATVSGPGPGGQRSDAPSGTAAGSHADDDLHSAADTGSVGGPTPADLPADAPREPTFGPREVPDAEGHEPIDEDASGPPRGAAAPAASEGDWLAAICPYLASADGTYRSATADEGNRCTAQDPPATLPLAFQERYCLTDRHTRCEMYKFAREAATDDVVSTETVAVVGPRPLRVARSARGSDGIDRRLIAGAAGLGGVIVLVVVLVLLMGGGSSQPPGGGGASLDSASSAAAAATDPPAETPTPRPTDDNGPSPDASAATIGNELVVRYEVQEGEALLAIAETFDTTRRRLWRMNEGLEAVPPAELPGQVILVPVPPTMTAAELEAITGYLGPADEA